MLINFLVTCYMNVKTTDKSLSWWYENPNSTYPLISITVEMAHNSHAN